MHRRNSFKNTQTRRPLGRSKSVNSIARNPVRDLVSIEPLTAERDAYIAATLSYLNAQSRGNAGQEVVGMSGDASSIGLARRNSFLSGPELSSPTDTVRRHDCAADSRKLHRQQSIRFAGPNAGPRRTLALRASVNGIRTKSSSPTLSGPDYAENQPPGTKFVPDKQLRKHASVQNYKSLPRMGGSVYALESDAVWDPSVCRKLRKSRSMYAPSAVSETPDRYHSNSGSVDRLREWLSTPGQDLANKSKTISPELRAPRSMSFIRGHGERSNARRDSRFAGGGSGADLARGEPRDGVPLGRSSTLKSQHSLFFRSRSKRDHSSTGFPRTLRNSSGNSTALSSAFSGETFSTSRQMGLRTTARKVSKSLRSRIKGFFGLPKSTDHSMTYNPGDQAGDNQSDVESCFRMYQSELSPQEASMSSVPSHLPAFHAVPSTQELRSRRGSFESIKGEDQPTLDDKSRVTSWTTSTANTTLSHGVQGNWEGKHLAAIREIGPTGPSTSLGPSAKRQKGLSAEVSSTQKMPLVDSQRVYSALVKRMEELRLRENRQQHLTDSNNQSPSASSPRRYRSRHPLRDESCHTIRCVRDDDDVFVDDKEGSVSSRKSLGSTESVVRHKGPHHKSDSADKTTSDPGVGDGQGTPPTSRTANPGVHLEVPNALSKRSSAFFGSPTCHLFRTASPYRRALRQSMRSAEESAQEAVHDTKYLGSLSALNLPVRCPSPDGPEEDVGATYTESVYSNKSDKANGSNLDDAPFPVPELTELSGNGEHGAATIFVQSPFYRPGPSTLHQRHISTASSVEWKTWLSANVSKLETSSTALKTAFPQDSPSSYRPYGHVREEAEIGGEVEATSAASPVTVALKVVDVPPLSAQSTLTPGCAQSGEVWRRRSQVLKTENTPPSMDRSQEACARETMSLMSSRDGLHSVHQNVQSVSNGSPAAPLEPRSRKAVEIPRMKSLSSLGKASPSREELLHKRRSRTRLRMGDSAKSSPGLTAAVEGQFGSTIPLSGSPGWAQAGRHQTKAGSTDGTELKTREDEGSGEMGSKRMVDLFLSSRRRRVGSGTRESSGSMGTAFI